MNIVTNAEGLPVKQINAKQRQSAIARFLQMIEVSCVHFYQGSPCWDWQGYLQTNGSGQFKVVATRKHIRKIGPHRFAYEYFIGEIQRNPFHLCGRQQCCSPLHLGLEKPCRLRDSSE